MGTAGSIFLLAIRTGGIHRAIRRNGQANRIYSLLSAGDGKLHDVTNSSAPVKRLLSWMCGGQA